MACSELSRVYGLSAWYGLLWVIPYLRVFIRGEKDKVLALNTHPLFFLQSIYIYKHIKEIFLSPSACFLPILLSQLRLKKKGWW
jgi:hypothetical protein